MDLNKKTCQLTANHTSFLQSTDESPHLRPTQCARSVPLLRAKEEISMARKVGQIIARGDHRWLIRVYLAAIMKLTNVNTTIEPSTVPCRKRKHT